MLSLGYCVFLKGITPYPYLNKFHPCSVLGLFKLIIALSLTFLDTDFDRSIKSILTAVL